MGFMNEFGISGNSKLGEYGGTNNSASPYIAKGVISKGPSFLVNNVSINKSPSKYTVTPPPY